MYLFTLKVMLDMPGKLFFIIFALISHEVTAQKKWAGPATGNWEEARNWQPIGTPKSTEAVILDNSYQRSNYKVTMPDTTVNVSTLLLEPADDNIIEVVIPVTSKSSPALIINDTGSSFTIKSGGIFSNSSGLISGQSIQTSGMISIYNGGKYIHNTRSSHATEIVAKLSATAGTKKGIFEFDVPGGSYPISISNRIYGTLELSSNASGGSQTYNASGSSPVIINGDFQINSGVQFNLDLTKDMVINTDYIQKGGVFNVASQNNNNTVKIKGAISQAASAIITETASGLPVIEICGDQKQTVSLAGNILNNITFKINNLQGVALMAPLILPYKFELVTGVIKTSKINLLILLAACTASGGSVTSFVDGPVKKTGDSDFEFPVGKQGDYAPIKITGSAGAVTDAFVAEYFLGNPALLYGYSFESPPVVRISQQEYWGIERLAGSSPKKITVSIGNYSNATDLEKLVIVRWDAVQSLWRNEGNSFYSGIATGTLVSNEVNAFGAFTLGSTVMTQNPLPLHNKAMELQAKIILSYTTRNAFLRFESPQNDLITIIVVDAGGRRVQVLKIAVLKGINKVPLELSPFAKGMYVFCLYDKAGKFLGSQKVLKM